MANNNNNLYNQILTRDKELAPSSYYFSFYDANYPNGDRVFYSRLQSGRCRADNKNGNRCRKRCVIGVEFCSSHLPIYMNLQIRPSEYGSGLFAYDPDANDNDIIFRKGDKVCNYEGQILTAQGLIDRYGQRTAPYGIRVNNNSFIDSAVLRGIGSMINHRNANPNVEFKLNARQQNIFLKATRNIRQNQQLFVDYGDEYHLHDDHRTRKYPTLY
jgi:hypothetical protein